MRSSAAEFAALDSACDRPAAFEALLSLLLLNPDWSTQELVAAATSSGTLPSLPLPIATATAETSPERRRRRRIPSSSNPVVNVAVTRQCTNALLRHVLAAEIPYSKKAALLTDLAAALEAQSPCFTAESVNVREQLAILHTAASQHTHAAQALSLIPLDALNSTMLCEEQKYRIYVATMSALIVCGDLNAAENYYSRAGFCAPREPDPAVHMRFRLAQAKIFDLRMRFVDAAHKYYELSRLEPSSPTSFCEAAEGVSSMPLLQLQPEPPTNESPRKEKTENNLILLRDAVSCALIAPAGVTRDRILATLYKDERVPTLGKAFVAALTKSHHGHFLRPLEISNFEATLFGHRASLTTDGSLASICVHPPTSSPLSILRYLTERTSTFKTTILTGFTLWQHAAMEHNVCCAARIYQNVTFESLGELLGVSPVKTCIIVAKMICNNRLLAKIDHVDSLITFSQPSNDDACLSNDISSICSTVERIASAAFSQLTTLS